MSIDVSHRDKYGFLTGSFDHESFSNSIDVLDDIEPFLFPCGGCNAIVFHVAVAQELGIERPLTPKLVVSTSKAYAALCNDCTMKNSLLSEDMVWMMRRMLLPSQILNLLMQFSKPGWPVPYSTAHIEQMVDGITAGGSDLSQQTYVRCILKCYAVETEDDALRQSFCWECAERIIPHKRTSGWLSQVFSKTPAVSYFCPKSVGAVRAPLSP
jgi:hypothetical protein